MNSNGNLCHIFSREGRHKTCYMLYRYIYIFIYYSRSISTFWKVQKVCVCNTPTDLVDSERRLTSLGQASTISRKGLCHFLFFSLFFFFPPLSSHFHAEDFLCNSRPWSRHCHPSFRSLVFGETVSQRERMTEWVMNVSFYFYIPHGEAPCEEVVGDSFLTAALSLFDTWKKIQVEMMHSPRTILGWTREPTQHYLREQWYGDVLSKSHSL